MLRGRVVLRRDLDDIAADDVDALQAVQDRLSLARGQASSLRRSGARREGRVEAVDVERDVGRAVADDLSRLFHDALDADPVDILDVQDGHPGFVGKPPEDLGRAADADLDRAFGVEHAGEHRLAERAAMVKFGPVDLAHRVAMRIDMDEADRPVVPERLQDRIGDRMVAADRQRPYSSRPDARVECLDVLDAAVEAEARAHRHVADVGGLALRSRHDAERMIVGADALDLAHRAGSEAGPRPVGNAEIHRHPDQRDIEPAKIGQIGRLRPVGQVQQGR